MNLSIRLARLCKHLVLVQTVLVQQEHFFVFASSWFDWFSSSWL